MKFFYKCSIKRQRFKWDDQRIYSDQQEIDLIPVNTKSVNKQTSFNVIKHHIISLQLKNSLTTLARIHRR